MSRSPERGVSEKKKDQSPSHPTDPYTTLFIHTRLKNTKAVACRKLSNKAFARRLRRKTSGDGLPNLVAMASNPVAMASSLVAMAITVIEHSFQKKTVQYENGSGWSDQLKAPQNTWP